MKTAKALAALSALAQESRLSVFRLLIQEGDEGIAAGKIAEILSIPPTTLSFHLTQLTNAGLIKASKEGRMIIYSANRKKLKKLVNFLTKKNLGDESEDEDMQE